MMYRHAGGEIYLRLQVVREGGKGTGLMSPLAVTGCSDRDCGNGVPLAQW